MATAPASVYWIGADKNVYLKGPGGVQNLGATNGTNGGSSGNYNLGANGFESNTLRQSVQAQQIADPNAPGQNPALPGANAGTNTSSVIPGVNDPATIAGYGQAIGNAQSAYNNTGTQLQGTENQINDAYNTAYQQLLGQANSAKADYGSNTTQNQQSYVTNKNAISANAGQSLNGIERLLGSRGAGGSSAALFSAPQAVAQQASIQRSGAGQSYGANQHALDQSYGTYVQGNQNDINSIGKQKADQTNAAQASIASTQAGLLQQIATLSAQKAAAQGGNPTAAAQPFLDQANSYLASAAKLGLNVAPLNYNTSAYAAPAASSYAVNPFAAAKSGNPSAGINNSNISNIFSPLLKGARSLSGIPNSASAPASSIAGA